MQGTNPDPVDVFARVLADTGGYVERPQGARPIAAAIARIAQGQGVREVLYEPTGLIDELGIRLLLTAHGVDLVTLERAADKAPHMRMSLTGAELAIAETGTLLLGGRPGAWGLASVLPWVHVVLLPAKAIVADLPTAFAQFQARLDQGERDWVWITGPSRTADIGHTLVLGAHGPNSLHVVVV
jgi:L-lactate utilization protein LutC